MERQYKIFKDKKELIKFLSGYNPSIDIDESLKKGVFSIVVDGKLFKSASLVQFFKSVSSQTGLDISLESSSQRGDMYVVYFNTPLVPPRRISITARTNKKG